MKQKAILIVDVQTELVNDKPYQCEKLLSNIQKIMNAAREKSQEVIFIRHNGCWGDELEPNTSGWEIAKEVSPLEGEMIIDKCHNSAFLNTTLHSYLQEKNISELVIMGLQTEYCIDTTVKVAFELGYTVIIPKDTTSTYNNEFMTAHEIIRFYERNIWGNRFAKILTVEQVIATL